MNHAIRQVAMAEKKGCPSSEVHPGQNRIMNRPIREQFREAELDWRRNSLLGMS
jgi:hypothetical protein